MKISPNDNTLKEELDDVVEKITKLVSEENRDRIMEQFEHLDQTDDNINMGIWKVKNKHFPKKTASVPSAKADINGRLVSDPNGLKNLYLDTFTHRLRQRPIKEKYSKLFELQKEVLDRRLIITSENKSPDWSEIDVIEVLKSLKNGKSRDPLGMCNEIFKPPVAGADLVTSLTIMMNKIKSDENLSDSNVGARKRKNIRNNSFIINGIINDTVSSKSKTIDLAILDYKQCFDALSVEICTNDMYNVGVTSDHLNLIHESDALSKIAIKTPLGLTKRVDVDKAVAQGEIPCPLKCTVTVDSISEEHTENLREHLYEYKGTVAIPPLGMVDDQVGISNCGLGSALTTSHLNTQTNIKKLQFGPKKCHKMHIGRDTSICTKNFIDTWKQDKKDDTVKSVLDLVDIEGDKHEMELLFSDSYLGDVIQSDGKNDLNIEEREGRGKNAVKQISQMLDDLCLGSYHFEVANVLRASLLISTLL